MNRQRRHLYIDMYRPSVIFRHLKLIFQLHTYNLRRIQMNNQKLAKMVITFHRLEMIARFDLFAIIIE